MIRSVVKDQPSNRLQMYNLMIYTADGSPKTFHRIYNNNNNNNNSEVLLGAIIHRPNAPLYVHSFDQVSYIKT